MGKEGIAKIDLVSGGDLGVEDSVDVEVNAILTAYFEELNEVCAGNNDPDITGDFKVGMPELLDAYAEAIERNKSLEAENDRLHEEVMFLRAVNILGLSMDNVTVEAVNMAYEMSTLGQGVYGQLELDFGKLEMARGYLLDVLKK